MKLQDFITENTNVIEVYFCPDKLNSESSILNCSWEQLPKLPLHMFKTRTDQELVEYAHRNIIYQYDVATDAQKTIQRNWIQDKLINSQYIVSVQEETLPTHRFPCTQELNNKKTLNRITYKWNNRIFLIVEKENNQYSYYVRYSHVQQIDIDKMNEEWNNLLKLLKFS
jgi:hypothetical protein